VLGAFSVEKILTEDRLERAFHLFDANGDNLISYQEIKTVLDSAKESTGGVDDAMIEKALKDIGKQAKNL
jgi:Ca2+-binding EF-hand superfamily protein